MEFLGEVEEHLREISVEARKSKQLSGVKEAAERGTLKLRNLKENYAGFLRLKRKAEDQTSSQSENNDISNDNENETFSFQKHDLIQPFLLACNYMDVGPRLTLLSLSGIQHLINRDAMHSDDGPNVMRVLSIQANSPSTEVQLRVLQSSLLLVSSKSCTITEELLSKALLVCFSLSQSKDATVRNAATATVRQVLSMLFDRVVGEQSIALAKLEVSKSGINSEEEPPLTMGLEGVGRCAYLVFQDLCVLSRGEQGVWLKRTCVQPSMGLELVESVLSQQPQLFSTDPMFSTLVSRQVCPLLLQILHERIEFPLFVRVIRAFTTLLRDFGHVLITQCETLIGALLHCLASNGLNQGNVNNQSGDTGVFENGVGASQTEKVWSSLLVLESLQAVCCDSKLLFTLYRVYDCAEDIEDVLKEEQEVQTLSPPSSSSSTSPSSMKAALALLKNDQDKKAKATNHKRPIALISNLVNVIAHFLTEGTSTENGMVLLFRGLKSLAAANHGHPIRPRHVKTNTPIATGIASTLSNFTSQHGSQAQQSTQQSTHSVAQQPRSNTNHAQTTLFAGSYSLRELSLETSAPAPAPENETLAIALNCLVAVSESLKVTSIEAFGINMKQSIVDNDTSVNTTTTATAATDTVNTVKNKSQVDLRIIRPPSSSITKNKSILSLEEFLDTKNEEDTSNNNIHKNSAASLMNDDDNDEFGGELSDRQKEIIHSQRAYVSAFVSCTWEHFLSVVSELLLQVNSAVAIAASHSNNQNHHHGNVSGIGNNNSVHNGVNSSQQTAINNSNNSNNNNNNGGKSPINTHRILLDKLLKICVSLTISAGACGLSAPRDCLLGTLCKASVPTPMINTSYPSSNSDSSFVTLHNHNTIVLKAVLVVSHTLANSLGPAWAVVVSTLDKVDTALRKSVKGNQAMTSSTEEKLNKALLRFIEFSRVLELDALKSLLEALMNLNRSNLSLNTTTPPTPSITSPSSSSSNTSQLSNQMAPLSQAQATPLSTNSNIHYNNQSNNQSSNTMNDYDNQFSNNNSGNNNGGGFGRAIGSLLTGVTDRFGVGKGLAASANAYYAPVTPQSSGSHMASSGLGSGGGGNGMLTSKVVDASASFSSSTPTSGFENKPIKNPITSPSPTLASASSPSSSSIPTSSSSSRVNVPSASTVPFALRALVSITSTNHHRLLSIWPSIVSHLELVANHSKSPQLRCFAIDAFRSITQDTILGSTSNADLKVGVQENKDKKSNVSNQELSISTSSTDKNSLLPVQGVHDMKYLGMLFSNNMDEVKFAELFLIDPLSLTKTSHSNSNKDNLQVNVLLNPLLSIANSTSHLEVKEQVLISLQGLITSCGDQLNNLNQHVNVNDNDNTVTLWPSILNILSTCCGRSITQDDSSQVRMKVPDVTTPNKTSNGKMSSSPNKMSKETAWGGQCVNIGFKCLKLITDDFLESVPQSFLPQVVECAASFVDQEIDMNVSLTAIEILWYVADYVQKNTKENNIENIKQSEKTNIKNSKDLKNSKNNLEKNDESNEISLKVWYIMMKEFSKVSLDSRPEVRNCGVNTLVTSVVSYGNSLSNNQWEFIFNSVLIPLVENSNSLMNIAAKDGDAGIRHEVRPGIQLTMHHSRDTASKQWSETKVLALQGLARLLRCALASPLNKEFIVLERQLPLMSASPRITLKAKKAAAAAAAATSSGSGGTGSAVKGKVPSIDSSESYEASNSWFSDAWYRMLLLGYHSIKSGDGSDGATSSSEVAVAGVFLLVLMNKISSSSGVSNEPVRYATGMRVVNGALVQMDKNKLKNEASAAAAAASSDVVLNKKWFSKVAWQSSWNMLLLSCDSYEIDEEGEISCALTEGLQQIFKSCYNNELLGQGGDGSNGSISNNNSSKGSVSNKKKETDSLSNSSPIIELLNSLSHLITPRYPPPTGGRLPFRLPITKAQKNSLILIKEIASKLSLKGRFEGDEQCWYALVSLLSKFSIPSVPISKTNGKPQIQNALSGKFCASTSEFLLELFSLDPTPPPTSSSTSSSSSSSNTASSSQLLVGFPSQENQIEEENKKKDEEKEKEKKKENDRIKAQSYLLSYIPAHQLENMERNNNNTEASNNTTASTSGGGGESEVGKVKLPPWAIASSFQGLLSGLSPLDISNNTVSKRSDQEQLIDGLKPFIVDGQDSIMETQKSPLDSYSLLPPVLRSPQAANRWLIHLTSQGADEGTTSYVLSESVIPISGIISTITTLLSVAGPGLRAIEIEEYTNKSKTLTSNKKTSKHEASSSSNNESSGGGGASDDVKGGEGIDNEDMFSFAEFSCAEDDDIPPPLFPWQCKDEVLFKGIPSKSDKSQESNDMKSKSACLKLSLSTNLGQGWYQFISSCDQLLLPWCIKPSSSSSSNKALDVESSIDIRNVLMSLVTDDKLAVFSSSTSSQCRFYEIPLEVSLKAIDMLAKVLFGLTTATILKASQQQDDTNISWIRKHKSKSNNNNNNNNNSKGFIDERWSFGEIPLIVYIIQYFVKKIQSPNLNSIEAEIESNRCLKHLHSWSHFILLLCASAHRLKPHQTSSNQGNGGGGQVVNEDEDEEDDYGVGFKAVKLHVCGAIESLSLLSLNTLSNLLKETTYSTLESNNSVKNNPADEEEDESNKVWKSKKNKIQQIVLNLSPILCENVAGVGASTILRRQSALLLRESKISETINNLRCDIEKSYLKASIAERKLKSFLNGNQDNSQDNSQDVSEAYATGFPF